MKYPAAQQFIYLTIEGAHFATASSALGSDKTALQVLLKQHKTPMLKEYLTTLKSTLEGSAFQYVLSLLSKGYIEAKDYSTELREQALEISLEKLLSKLSDSQQCTLCDQEGFLIAYSGFDTEKAEQAAALAIEISDLQHKRQHNLNKFSDSQSSFINVADKNGNTTMRFLPLYFNQQTFVLAIKGKALTQQGSFIQLIWLLGQRYL